MKYRAEIDGLRAFAVLSVVFFHAFPTVLRGGFVGVDIFFVLSGYLISTIIFEGLEKGTFGFGDFYVRRIRRIFPSLLTVMVSALLFGGYILMADQYAQLGNHIALGALFTVNFTLISESGYFDTASETKPLLHLWSLAVEEQFYILWPIGIWVLTKRKYLFLPAALLVLLASFLINVSLPSSEHSKIFFSPQTRFWELLSGSVLAWISIHGIDNYFPTKYPTGLKIVFSENFMSFIRRIFDRNLLGYVGFIILILSIIFVNGKHRYPGYWALLPVLGSVLVIASGSKGWINRSILSSPIAVWIGLISYPLYLWHWPIFSFLRIIVDDEPSIALRICAIVFSVVLAFLTYRFIERPLRFGKRRWTKAAILCGAMVIVGACGYLVKHERGFPERYRFIAEDVSDFELLKTISEAWEFQGYPTPRGARWDEVSGFYAIGENDRTKVLLIGDSHAFQYINALSLPYADNAALPMVMLNISAHFPPVLEDVPVKDDSTITTVALSYYWALHYGSRSVEQTLRCCGAGKNRTIGTITVPYKTTEEMDILDIQIEEFIRELRDQGKRVFIVLDNPFGEELNAQSMISRVGFKLRLNSIAPLSRRVAIERSEPVRSRLIDIARRTGASVIDPILYLCNEAVCPAFSEEGELLYKDYDHISLYAAQHKAGYITRILGMR